MDVNKKKRGKHANQAIKARILIRYKSDSGFLFVLIVEKCPNSQISTHSKHYLAKKQDCHFVKTAILTWRRRWDSNPRTVARHLISSQGRYDHFDTPPRQESLYPRFAANVKACSGRGGDCAQDLTLGGNSDLSSVSSTNQHGQRMNYKCG